MSDMAHFAGLVDLHDSELDGKQPEDDVLARRFPLYPELTEASL